MSKKTKKKPAKGGPNPGNPESAKKLSHVYLGHACRETLWIREHIKEMNLCMAIQAKARREAWLQAALVAEERGL